MLRMRKFLCLTAPEQRLLLSAAVLLGAIRLGLWLLPFRALQRWVTQLGQRSTRVHPVNHLPIDRIVWAVQVASRYVPQATCLTQALGVQVLLARRAHPASLHIGMTKHAETGQFAAHAWVESQGRIVIGGSASERYTSLLTLGKAAS